MDETQVVIMQKDKGTGFLEKELASFKIFEHENLIVNVFADYIDNPSELFVYMKITTERDVLDWEFLAIYDYYDEERIISGGVTNVSEIEDCYNPTWEIIFPFNELELEDQIQNILNLHFAELMDVYETIKDKESEYSE